MTCPTPHTSETKGYIMTEQLNTMTVGELIESLQGFDENTPVVLSYQYGDYWRSICANTVGRDDIDEGEVEWSGYHETWKLSKDDGEFEDGEYAEDDDKRQVAVVIGPKYW